MSPPGVERGLRKRRPLREPGVVDEHVDVPDAVEQGVDLLFVGDVAGGAPDPDGVVARGLEALHDRLADALRAAGDDYRPHARSAFRSILPEGVLGSSETISTTRGDRK